MQSLGAKLLDIFVYKYDKKLSKGQFNFQSTQSFDSALSLIYEDTLVEYVKLIFIELNAQNMLIPWIYLFYNAEFNEQSVLEDQQSISVSHVRRAAFNTTNSRSEVMYRGQASIVGVTTHQLGGTGTGVNQLNSNINECNL